MPKCVTGRKYTLAEVRAAIRRLVVAGMTLDRAKEVTRAAYPEHRDEI